MRSRRGARRLAGCVGVALTLLAAPEARANGRFPFANQLVVKTGPDADLYVRTSFGVLVSRDKGAFFDWICEPIIGFSGTQDPGLGVFDDGSISVAAFEGLFGSNDGGCSFSQAAAFAGEYVIDVAVFRDAPLHGIAVTSTARGEGYHVQALGTVDGGRTWSTQGGALDEDILSLTIDVAPSREQRLYVSGFVTRPDETRVGVFAASDDAGVTWTRTEVDLAGDTGLYIGAVDPVNPDVVYLRTDGVNDRLLVTRDAGKTIVPGPPFPGALLGLAVSPDGTRLAIGGPDGGVRVALTDAPTAGELVFADRADKKVSCLTWHASGLYACGNDFSDGFFIGRSDDEGASWTPLVPRLRDVRGPLLTCAADSKYAAVCPPLWPAQRAALGGADPDPLAGNGGAGGTAGGAGSPPLAGQGGSVATGAGAAGAPGADVPPPPADDCACAQPGRGEPNSGAPSLALAFAGAVALGLSRRRGRAGGVSACSRPPHGPGVPFFLPARPGAAYGAKVSQVAIIAWSPSGASIRAGDLVFVDELEEKRARIRHAETGHVGRVRLDHLVLLPQGVEAEDARLEELVPQLRALLEECEHLAEARELSNALVHDVFGPG